MGLIVWYIILCAFHYANQRPLWIDEYAVFESLENFKGSKDYFGRTLWAGQVFPRVYLFIINKFSVVFEYSLLSLRFFSFIAMISAFAVWVRLSALEIKDKFLYGTFLLSWSSSVVMVYYSAELKPYSMDVLVSSLFMLLLYDQDRWKKDSLKPWQILVLIVMPFAVLFSYMTYLFIPLVIYNFLLLTLKNSQYQRSLIVFILASMLATILSYQFDISITDRETVSGVVKDYFIHTDSVRHFFKTFGEGVNNLFSRWYATEPRIFRSLSRVFVGFALIQMFVSFFANFFKNNFRVNSLKTIPFVIFCEFVVLGALHKYPFTMPRTSLIFCPMVLLMTIQGMNHLKKIHINIYRIFISLYVVFISVVMIGIAKSIFNGDLGAMQKIW